MTLYSNSDVLSTTFSRKRDGPHLAGRSFAAGEFELVDWSGEGDDGLRGVLNNDYGDEIGEPETTRTRTSRSAR